MFSSTRIVVCAGVKNGPVCKDNNKEKPKMNMRKQIWRAAVSVAIVVGAMAANAGDFRVAAEGGRAEIQQAIDAAAAAGGGRVVVAPGVHPTGSLRIRSHVELHLEKGAVLLGSTKREDYDDFPRDVCNVSPESSYRALIQAWDADDIAITGKGTIDGQGPAFYDRKPPAALRREP